MRTCRTVLMLVLLSSGTVAGAAPQSHRPLPADPEPSLVQRLFPETVFEGEEWRSLLPVMLMNHEQEARQPLVRARGRDAATR